MKNKVILRLFCVLTAASCVTYTPAVNVLAEDLVSTEYSSADQEETIEAIETEETTASEIEETTDSEIEETTDSEETEQSETINNDSSDDSQTDDEDVIVVDEETPSNVTAAPVPVQIGDYSYIVTNGTAYISAFDPSSTETSITVPSTVEIDGTTYTINTIGTFAFKNCTNLETVVLPETITVLDRGAFQNCTSLKKLVINNDLRGAGDQCMHPSRSYDPYQNFSIFLGAGQNSTEFEVIFQGKATCVPEYLFATPVDKTDNTYAKITKVTLSPSIKEIQAYAFANCHALKDIVWSNVEGAASGVTNIGINAFRNDESLTDIVFPASVTTIGKEAFVACSGIKNLVIPATMTTIGQSAFHSCSGITDLTIESNATLNDFAFQDCSSITNLTINGNCTITRCVFKGCTSLAKLNINGNLSDAPEQSLNSGDWQHYDGYSVFMDAGKNAPNGIDVTFGENVTVVPARLFATQSSKTDGSYAHVSSITFGDNITTISSAAFHHCFDIKSITWGSEDGKNCQIASIDSQAFNSAEALTELNIPASVKTIGESAFIYCNGLTKLTIPSTVNTVGAHAFADCINIKNVTIDGNASFDKESFARCTSITDLVVNGNAKFNWGNFFSCTSLTNATINGNCVLGGTAFKDCTSLAKLTINGDLADAPDQSLNGGDWQHYDGYSVFCNAGKNAPTGLEVVFGENTTIVPARLFATAASKTDGTYAHVSKITFSDSVKTISDYAFNCCYDLKEIVWGTDGGKNSTVSEIKAGAFNLNQGLVNLTLPESLTIIGKSAFRDCTGITELTLPKNLLTVGEYAFSGCTDLKKLVSLGNTNFGPKAFENCVSMKDLTLEGNGVLAAKAFAQCTSLENLVINGDLADAPSESINTDWHRYDGYSVFLNAGRNASNMKITFGEGVTRIPSFLFATAASKSDGDYIHVKDLYLPLSLEAIGEYALFNCHDLKTIHYPGKEERLATIMAPKGNELSETTTIEAEGQEYSKNSAVLYVKAQKGIIFVEAKKERADGKAYKITSSDKKVATLSKTGKLTCKKAGTTTITVYKKDIIYKYEITVRAPKVKSKMKLTLTEKGSVELTGAEDLDATFSSSNEAVATVDSLGNITPVKAGKATIITTINGKQYKTKVSVKK